jgi:hypothetical protein
VKCNCLAIGNGKWYHAEDYVMKFLVRLSDDYDVVKTQILMPDPLPDIDRVFSLVISHERQISTSIVENSHNFMNAVDGRKSYGKGKNNLKVCTFYHKTGHTESVCYKKHGYPRVSKGQTSSYTNNVVGDNSDVVSDDEHVSHKADSSFNSLCQQSSITLS